MFKKIKYKKIKYFKCTVKLSKSHFQIHVAKDTCGDIQRNQTLEGLKSELWVNFEYSFYSFTVSVNMEYHVFSVF